MLQPARRNPRRVQLPSRRHATNPALSRFGVAVLVTSIGTGAWYTCWALFLTGFAGLTPAQVGAGITLAGGLGVVAGPGLGRLADRIGPKRVMLPLVLLQAAAFFAYLFVHGLWSFLAVAAATVGADRASYGVRAALTLSFAGSHDRLMALSAVRVRNSTGFTIGAAVGALAIALGTRAGYLAIAVLNSATFVVYAAIVTGTQTSASVVPADVDTEGDPLDGPARRHPVAYGALALTMGVLSLCWAMLSTALPLWVARRTGAPHWISGAVVIVNAGVIAGLQPAFARRISTAMGAARGAVLAGLALAASCPIFALSYHGAGAGAIAIILLGAGVHVTGELLFVASAWGLSVLLMPAGAAGRYQGFFSTGQVTGLMVGPVVMTTLVLGLGPAGWLGLGALFIIAVIPTTRITRHAVEAGVRPERRRLAVRRLERELAANADQHESETALDPPTDRSARQEPAGAVGEEHHPGAVQGVECHLDGGEDEHGGQQRAVVGEELRKEGEGEHRGLGVGGNRQKRGAKGGPGAVAGAERPGERRGERVISIAVTGTAPRADAEADENDRADDVHCVEQDVVGGQERRQPRAAGEQP